MIASYGDAIVDLFATPVGSSIEDASSFEPHVGGSTCNVAVVAARAGARVRFIGAVGPDPWGQRLRSALEREGIDTRTLVTIHGARTPVTFCTSAPDGTRSFLSYRSGGADSAFALSHLDDRALQGVRWLHLASSSLRASPRSEATRQLVSTAISKGVRVSLDLNVRPGLWGSDVAMRHAIDWLCARATLVKASEEDLAHLGLRADLDALSALAPEAIACVLTRAERGAEARVALQTLRVAAPAVTFVDAIGAGDAFVGALLAQLYAHESLAQSPARWTQWLAVACEAGACAVTQVGATSAVTRARLAEAMDRELTGETQIR